MSHKNIRSRDIKGRDNGVKVFRHLMKRAFPPGRCAPAKSRAIVTVSRSKFRQLRLQDAPVERRSSDAGFQDDRRIAGAELTDVDSTIFYFDQSAGCSKFAAVEPEAEKLRGNLQEQDGGDDGEREHGASLF
jgi:hypothetical protein